MGLLSDIFIKIRKARVYYLAYAPYKKLIDEHKEWKKLTPEEKAAIRCGGYTHTVYKNLCPKWDGVNSARYFVADAYFQAYLLPKLSPINYGLLGINHVLHYYSDKNYQEYFMQGLQFPANLVRNVNGEFYDANMQLISEAEAAGILEKAGEVVYKKSLGAAHGAGIQKGTVKDFDDIKKRWKKDYQAQALIDQHEFFSYFNESSVNTIRIVTIFWRGEVYITGAMLRVGPPGAFCDHLSGESGGNSVVIPINLDGTMGDYAIDRYAGVVKQDVFGKPIKGTVPRFEEIKQLLIDNHKRYAHHRIIGWDISLDKDENIICVEYNTDCPGITKIQLATGPIFATKTVRGTCLLDEILEEKA